MTVRLGELIESGEICNTRWYSVHGWIRLRGSENPILLQLTGNCDPDLAGWRIRFRPRNRTGCVLMDPASLANDPTAESFDPASLAGEQIGPTGTMTGSRRVKVANCTRAELERRSRLDEPPPSIWKRSLYLEWFSQDGQVVVELADPIIEFVEFNRIDAPRESDSLLGGATTTSSEPSSDDVGASSIGSNVDGSESCDDGVASPFDPDGVGCDESCDEAEAEPEWWNDEDKPQFIREMELMDELIERGNGEIIGSLFEGPVRFLRPDQLDEAGAERSLKTLLAHMALFNISLDVCEHFSPREAYRLLIERICTEEQAYPELRHTQWIQHFTTAEFCPQCEAEWERECEELERRRKHPPADEPWREDDGSEDELAF